MSAMMIENYRSSTVSRGFNNVIRLLLKNLRKKELFPMNLNEGTSGSVAGPGFVRPWVVVG